MAKILDLGHSCFQLTIKGKKIITDPFIKSNNLAKNIDFNALEADYILVSHGHADHTADLLELAKQTEALVIANFEITAWVQKQGYQHVHPMNIGGNYQAEFGRVKMVRAEHSSSFEDGSYAGNPGGFVIDSDDATIYFAGDTALTYDHKLIGEEFDLDLAILPIGDNFTMGIADAATTASWVACRRVVGMHYDTFGYIVIDHDEARECFSKAGMELHLLGAGNSIEVHKS
jgi:L-ascorbate metabolism protein UlaG (beta-lactamase superfamily)